MELFKEDTQVQMSQAELEAQKHNALISERYNRLKNAVANQFAEDVRTEEHKNTYQNTFEISTYISPNATANTATYTSPTMTEYFSRPATSLFGMEKFERMGQMHEDMQMTRPVELATPIERVEIVQEPQYSLSSMAKVVVGVFACVVVSMMALICVNTHTINQKRMNIQALETRKAALVQEYQDLQERIETATSEETIREYAESQGMVKN